MLKALALGDSYTIGEGVPAEDSWPWQLIRRLRLRDALIAAPEVIAATGWTSGELISAINDAALQPPYDLVGLLIGVNNQYRGLDLESYEREFETLLAKAIELAGAQRDRVFVLSIPDWSVTPFAEGRDREAVAAEINSFNRVNARLAYREQVNYLNITGISRKAKHAQVLIASDGLHYSTLMYRFWVDEMLPRVWRLLYPGKDINIPLLYQETETSDPNCKADNNSTASDQEEPQP